MDTERFKMTNYISLYIYKIPFFIEGVEVFSAALHPEHLTGKNKVITMLMQTIKNSPVQNTVIDKGNLDDKCDSIVVENKISKVNYRDGMITVKFEMLDKELFIYTLNKNIVKSIPTLNIENSNIEVLDAYISFDGSDIHTAHISDEKNNNEAIIVTTSSLRVGYLYETKRTRNLYIGVDNSGQHIFLDQRYLRDTNIGYIDLESVHSFINTATVINIYSNSNGIEYFEVDGDIYSISLGQIGDFINSEENTTSLIGGQLVNDNVVASDDDFPNIKNFSHYHSIVQHYANLSCGSYSHFVLFDVGALSWAVETRKSCNFKCVSIPYQILNPSVCEEYLTRHKSSQFLLHQFYDSKIKDYYALNDEGCERYKPLFDFIKREGKIENKNKNKKEN